MDIKKLMIGNWVNYRPGCIDEETHKPTYFAETGFPIRLTCLYHNMSQYDDEEQTYEVADYELSPIPITTEILEKNGFGYIEKDEHLSHYFLGEECYCKNMDLHIGTDNKGNYWLNYYNNSIYGLRHIHQLQHAFRLLGIEKEIEL